MENNNFKRKTPLFSIIIPSWFTPGQNGRWGENETFWFAAKCLERLFEVTKGNFELIIIDNGSTLSDKEVLGNHYCYTVSEYFSLADILIRNQTNLGFGPACNQGFYLARGEYIICLNNDLLLWNNWVDALIEPFNNKKLDPPAGVVMPALVNNLRDANEALKLRTVDLSQNYDALGPHAEFGSLWCTTKEIMEDVKINGYVFDERFTKAFKEDRDLWRRIRLLGKETYRTHKNRVYHLGNLSITKLENRKQYTIPNRIYFEKLSEKECDGTILSEKEKDILRLEAQQEYERDK